MTVEVTKAVSTTSATASHDQVKVKKGTTTIEALVDSGDVPATGEVVVIDGATQLARATLVNGRASMTVGPFDEVGTKTLTVRYLGDDGVEWSETTLVIEVVKRKSKD